MHLWIKPLIMAGKTQQYGKLLDGKFVILTGKIKKYILTYLREIWSNWSEILICLQQNKHFFRPCLSSKISRI